MLYESFAGWGTKGTMVIIRRPSSDSKVRRGRKAARERFFIEDSKTRGKKGNRLTGIFG